MNYQNELQKENYERELADKKALIADDRKYNSIGAQMQRAKDAGVSPLAALGVSSNSSISAQSPTTGGVSVPGPPEDSLSKVGETMLASIRATQQDEQIAIQRRIAKKEAEETDARIAKLNEETIGERIRNAILPDTLKQELQNLVSEGKWKEADTRLKSALADTEDATRGGKVEQLSVGNKLTYSKYLTEQTMREIDAELKRSELRATAQQISESISREELNWQNVNNLIEQEKLTMEQAEKVRSEVKTLQKQRQKTDAEIKAIDSNTKLDEQRKQELISRVVSNYTHDITDLTNTLKRLFEKSGNSSNADKRASAFVDDLLIGAAGAVFD